MNYVYIISNNEGHIKVGIAKNPKKRIKQLQTGSPYKLALLFAEEFECERKHLLNIERLIHKEIREKLKNVSGEWFAATDNDLLMVKQIIIINRINYDANPLAFMFR